MVSSQAVFGQLLLGLINGSFYALLSLGFAVIFGLLGVVNVVHGALYMAGAFTAWIAATYLGINYWWALLLVPVAIGIVGIGIEQLTLRHLRKLDPLYGLLLTFGLTLMIEGCAKLIFGVSSRPYPIPELLARGVNLGFMYLPLYRAWVVVVAIIVCLLVWYGIERTRLGATLRAATERPDLTQAFGINVPRLVTLTYAGGVALAAFAGVLAAPMNAVSPLMGSDIITIVFAVVVIGGMGSILGSILTGLGVGVLEGLTKLFYAEASSVSVFILMVLVILIKPTGLFGRAA